MKKILIFTFVAVLICSFAAAMPASAATSNANNPWKSEKVNVRVIEDFSDTAYYKPGVELKNLNFPAYDSLIDRQFPDYKKTIIKVVDKQLQYRAFESDAIFWSLKNSVPREEMKKATGMGYYVKNNNGADICLAFYGLGTNSKDQGALWQVYGLKATIIDKSFNSKDILSTYDQFKIPAGFEGWMIFDIADFNDGNSPKSSKPPMVPGDYSLDCIGIRNYGNLPKDATDSQMLIIDDFFLYGTGVTHSPGDIKLPFVKTSTSSTAAPKTSSVPKTSAPNASAPKTSAAASSAVSGTDNEASGSIDDSSMEIIGTKVNATVEGENEGDLPENAQINVTNVTEGELYEMADEALSSYAEKFALYNMKLIKDEAEIEPNGFINISIPGPVGFSKGKLDVVKIVNGSIEKADWSLSEDGKKIIIKTDQMGNFAVVNKAANSASSQSTGSKAAGSEDDDKTGGLPWWIFLISGGVFVFAAAGVLVFLKVKKLAFFAEKQ